MSLFVELRPSVDHEYYLTDNEVTVTRNHGLNKGRTYIFQTRDSLASLIVSLHMFIVYLYGWSSNEQCLGVKIIS